MKHPDCPWFCSGLQTVSSTSSMMTGSANAHDRVEDLAVLMCRWCHFGWTDAPVILACSVATHACSLWWSLIVIRVIRPIQIDLERKWPYTYIQTPIMWLRLRVIQEFITTEIQQLQSFQLECRCTCDKDWFSIWPMLTSPQVNMLGHINQKTRQRYTRYGQ